MRKLLFTSALSILLSLNTFSINIVSNGDFETGTTFGSNHWTVTSTSPGVQTVGVDNNSLITGSNCLKVDVTTTAGASYITRLAVYQYLSIPKSSTYTVSFTAKASATCNIQSNLAQSFTGYNALTTSPIFNVTTSPQTFSYDITTTSVSTGLCKLSLFYGSAASGTTVYIDDVTIVEKTALTNRNLCNGDFETTMSNSIYNPSSYTYNGLTSGTPDATQNQLYYGWSLDKLTASTADLTAAIGVDGVSGTKSISLTSVGTATSTATDAMLCWIFAGQKDKYYTVSFKARASASCTMAVGMSAVSWTGSSCTYISAQTCNLTTSDQTITYTSTLPFLQSADGRVVLQFQLGKLANGLSVTIDDVVLAVKETPTITWSQDLSTLKTTDSPVALTATSNLTSSGSPSANDISYSSDNTGVVTVSGSTLTVVGAGTANITASQLTNSFHYAATPVIIPVAVTLDVPTGLNHTNNAALLITSDKKIVLNVAGEIQVFNIAGQSIVSKEVLAGDVIALNAGVYFVRLISNNVTTVRKIVL